MKRRTVIATLGALPLTAGCLAPPRSDSQQTATGGDATATADPGERCSSFESDVDRTVCWPTEERLRSRVYLNASIPTFEPTTDDSTVETLEFVLHNQHPDHLVEVTPEDWQIARRTPEDWRVVASASDSEPTRLLPSGERYTWSLSLRRHPTPSREDTTYLARDLADGVYAFQTVARLLEDPAVRVECIAVVEIRRQ